MGMAVSIFNPCGRHPYNGPMYFFIKKCSIQISPSPMMRNLNKTGGGKLILKIRTGFICFII